GVSGPKALTKDHVQSMNDNPVVFALANPTPEIYPEEAIEAGATIIGTGRSDYPNQINNLLAFPGIFRGVLDAQSSDITTEMKITAAKAIAESIREDQLAADFIIPNALDKNVAHQVAEAVKHSAKKEGKILV
ncbi:malic enzyme-like NAD(P)-binding protein, partial [Staphylococcus equorum]|uniref:malic enzyme-like NAD(P)-binding protein n=1 Tax=Staphylococcus equorum TaxID=246432 RepID=UPI003EBBF35D